MSYLERVNNHYPDSFSKVQSLAILEKYKADLTAKEYDALYSSLCSHALENMYLNEKDILVSIAHFRNEISLDEIVEMVKAS
jgi:trehalose utilization protein